MKPAAPLPRAKLEQRLFWSRSLTLGSYALLLLMLLLGLLLFPPAAPARWWVILLVLWLPLLAFLPALLYKHAKAHAWLCFISLVYFSQGVTTAFLPEKFWLGAIQALAALILFLAAMLYSRWRSMQLRGAILD